MDPSTLRSPQDWQRTSARSREFCVFALLLEPSVIARSCEQHQALAEAIADGNPSLASEKMKDHITCAAEQELEAFNRLEGEAEARTELDTTSG